MAVQIDKAIHLNAEQQRAVTHAAGPLLIIAGAGTGKTTVITERIKWLIQEKKIKPEEILALTFTEKAAAEMEERVDVALPLGYNRTWIMTFHGFCERVLRQDAIQIGLDPGFKILGEAEMQLFIKRHLFEFDLRYFRPQGNPTKFLSGLITHFARLKDEDVEPSQYLQWAKQLEKRPNGPKVPNYETEELQKFLELTSAYEKYEKLKVANSVMDFADLIANTLKLLRERPNVLRQYQQQFRHVLIDEFQDTNYAQNHLAIMLAGDDHHITAVCDDDQSIYRWRGAAVYNVLDFKKHFPKAKVVTLTKNYRSGQEILDRSHDLIQNNNPDRLEVKEKINKRLVSQSAHTSVVSRPISLIWQETVEDEAERVVEEIEVLAGTRKPPRFPEGATETKVSTVGHNGHQYSDFAILVRANNHAEPFVKALKRRGIPYQFLGPGKLFKQPEIKNLIAYLKVLNNFEDNVALYKVLSMPLFHLHGRDVMWVLNQARKLNQSAFQVLEIVTGDSTDALAETQLTAHGMLAETTKQMRDFVEMVHRHLDSISRTGTGQILYYFLKDTGWLKSMQDPESERAAQAVENVRAFFDVIKGFETQYPESNLMDFVEYLDFLTQAGESPRASGTDRSSLSGWSQTNAVNILTVHSAKGLEFPVVFLVNLVDLRFPTTNRREQIPLPEELIKEPAPTGDPHLAEERRLFYVGMTRAKQQLYLTGAKFYRPSTNSGQVTRPKKLSSFVREALGEDLERYLVPKTEVTQKVLFEFEGEQGDNAIQPSDHPAIQQKVTYLSYSQIETFRTCPLHYKLDHIVKIPKPPTGALAFGTAVHDTLKDVYAWLSRLPSTPGVDEAFDKAMEIYQKHWSPLGYESKEHEQKYFENGKRMLREFLEKDLEREFTVVKLEESFTFNIAPDLKLGGRIDRIDQLPDGTYEIIDYKTGQLPNDRDLEGNGGKGLQLSIYALAVTHPQVFNYSLDKVVLSFYYLEAGEKVSFTRTAEELDVARNEIIKVRDAIQSSDFACSHAYFCQQGCEYKLFCE